jgi:ribosome-binding protein aMBF1 (putative translation factor)
MIQNQHQYRVTKTALAEFERALEQYTPSPKLHPRLAKAQRDAMQGQIDTLKAELRAFEALQTLENPVPLEALEELPRRLVQARVAAGLTQAALAKRLGLKTQQVQRYEASQYASASYTRLVQVARAIKSAR